jgi:transcriptional regulator with XRE-family HTH domain
MTTYEKIQLLCDRRGIRLSTLSEATGVRSSVFTELKMGRTKKLSAATLEKLAAFFQVPPGYLMDDPAAADEVQEEIFRKRMALFDLSEKAGAAELDTVFKLMQYLVGEE